MPSICVMASRRDTQPGVCALSRRAEPLRFSAWSESRSLSRIAQSRTPYPDGLRLPVSSEFISRLWCSPPRGSGVHPDHKAVTDIVVNGVFYARLPKWDEISEGASLEGSEAHEIQRLFFGHCRMEPPWSSFDFAVDVTRSYGKKLEALRAYEAVFSGDQTQLLDKYTAEDRYIGSLVGVQYAEAFKPRSPLLVNDPEVFFRLRFG